MENKTLVFDMDGTIANLYAVENWLEDLRSENPRPYEVAVCLTISKCLVGG